MVYDLHLLNNLILFNVFFLNFNTIIIVCREIGSWPDSRYGLLALVENSLRNRNLQNVWKCSIKK